MASFSPVRSGRRWLYLTHRWVGVVTCLLTLIWFGSGLVMMYVPYPALQNAERLAGLGPLDWERVLVTPDAAIKAAGLAEFPRELRLESLAGEPVYRITDADGERLTLSAADATRRGSTDAAKAVIVAREFSRSPTARLDATVERDQWTVAQRYNADRPLHRIDVGDGNGTRLYVSSRSGAVVADTTRTERAWNWVGSVPHWIYFTAIRRDGDVWRQVVMWASGPALLGTIAGIWVGLLRLRLKPKYNSGAVTPYRGWMKWHHVTGLIGGLLVVTWLFSGWLSVNPFGWFDRSPTSPEALARYAGVDEPRHLTELPLDALAAHGDAREARFTWVDGTPLIVLSDASGEPTVLDGAGRSFRFPSTRLIAAAARLEPEAKVASAEQLTKADSYWYSHHTDRPLPVLRIMFADEARTWYHIHPQTGQILGRVDAGGRLYRWLFNGLHSLDFGPLIRNRPAWDVVVWSLSAIGAIVAVTGVVIAWRRLAHKFRLRPRLAPRKRPRLS
jgi:uncharacterized iron-regulated membrane protein